MPNIASVLKEEILRLARKEVRTETEGLKKAVAQFRSDIAGLKRRVAALEKQLSQAERKSSKKTPANSDAAVSTRTRFSAKGLATQRQKLGFSAADMGTLLGVSAQTIYNWETGKSKPRPTQLAAIFSVRGIGKRQAKARIESLSAQ